MIREQLGLQSGTAEKYVTMESVRWMKVWHKIPRKRNSSINPMREVMLQETSLLCIPFIYFVLWMH